MPGVDWDELGEDGDDQRNMPVTQVSADEAREFCSWQDHGRLPSEAEWEFLARSRGQDRPFPWGDAEPTAARAEHDSLLGWLQPLLSWSVCDHPDGDTEQGPCDVAIVAAPDDGSPWIEPCDGDGVARGGSWYAERHDELRTTHRERVPKPWRGPRSGAAVPLWWRGAVPAGAGGVPRRQPLGPAPGAPQADRGGPGGAPRARSRGALPGASIPMTIICVDIRYWATNSSRDREEWR